MPSMVTCIGVLLPALLLLWRCGAVDGVPLFGALLGGAGGSGLGGAPGNATGVGPLALNHLQHKVNALNAFFDFFATGLNATQTAFNNLG